MRRFKGPVAAEAGKALFDDLRQRFGEADFRNRGGPPTMENPRASADTQRHSTPYRQDPHMPSFDIVSEVDKHELTNAVDQARRDLGNRYDLRGTDARFEHVDNVITQFAPSEYQLDQLLEMLRLRLAGRKIDLRCIELGEVETNLAGARRTITIKQGIEQAQAKKIIARIKEAKLKVDTQITGEKLRINSKKRDDLQLTMALLRTAELELPLQFENFRD